MKAVTLWQPWAAAMAARIKIIETRDWPPPVDLIGQRVALHAAKKKIATHETGRLVDGYEDALGRFWPPTYGTVLGTFRLVGAAKILTLQGRDPKPDEEPPQGLHPEPRDVEWLGDPVDFFFDGPSEIHWGDLRPGRWAWLTADLEVFPLGIPAVGRQKIWNWTPPADVTVLS